MTTHYHIVVSPKQLVDKDLLHEWIQKHSDQYVIGLEHGQGGHPHYDIYCQLKPEFQRSRDSSLKRSLVNHLSKLHKFEIYELKNIKFCVNKQTEKPHDYGYGYAAKEGNVLYTTFDTFDIADFVDYYETHKEKIVKALSAVKTEKYYTMDQLGHDLLTFVQTYESHIPINYQPGDWIITEFLRSLGPSKLTLSLFNKLNEDKLKRFVEINVVRTSLDSAHSQTQHNTIINTSEKHPLL